MGIDLKPCPNCGGEISLQITRMDSPKGIGKGDWREGKDLQRLEAHGVCEKCGDVGALIHDFPVLKLPDGISAEAAQAQCELQLGLKWNEYIERCLKEKK